jgi:predicted DNA-binding transcriptional regulator AlpA
VTTERPPAYVSRATLAHELDCAESTVDVLVQRGVLPKPIRLSNGCVRWCWTDIVLALGSLNSANVTEADPYMQGIRNVKEAEAK